MALLQISEPGQSPNPHERRIAVGIDLGTTHSLVAAVRNGTSECLPDAQGRVILPSVVRYVDMDRRQIGHEALENQVNDPGNTIASVKRLMGRGLRVLNRNALTRIRLTMPRMAYASEFLSAIVPNGLSYVEVPTTVNYTEYSRAKGQTNLNAVNILFDLAVNRMRAT